jgi:hypothetical protein
MRALRVPAWSGHTRIAVNNDPERTSVSAGYQVLHRQWRPGDVITLHLDLTPRLTYPDRRVDAVRGCVAIERGPLVYCFEQADKLDGARVDDLAVRLCYRAGGGCGLRAAGETPPAVRVSFWMCSPITVPGRGIDDHFRCRSGLRSLPGARGSHP